MLNSPDLTRLYVTRREAHPGCYLSNSVNDRLGANFPLFALLVVVSGPRHLDNPIRHFDTVLSASRQESMFHLVERIAPQFASGKT